MSKIKIILEFLDFHELKIRYQFVSQFYWKIESGDDVIKAVIKKSKLIMCGRLVMNSAGADRPKERPDTTLVDLYVFGLD